jgi:hypothetical protein
MVLKHACKPNKSLRGLGQWIKGALGPYVSLSGPRMEVQYLGHIFCFGCQERKTSSCSFRQSMFLSPEDQYKCIRIQRSFHRYNSESVFNMKSSPSISVPLAMVLLFGVLTTTKAIRPKDPDCRTIDEDRGWCLDINQCVEWGGLPMFDNTDHCHRVPSSL